MYIPWMVMIMWLVMVACASCITIEALKLKYNNIMIYNIDVPIIIYIQQIPGNVLYYL